MVTNVTILNFPLLSGFTSFLQASGMCAKFSLIRRIELLQRPVTFTLHESRYLHWHHRFYVLLKKYTKCDERESSDALSQDILHDLHILLVIEAKKKYNSEKKLASAKMVFKEPRKFSWYLLFHINLEQFPFSPNENHCILF